MRLLVVLAAAPPRLQHRGHPSKRQNAPQPPGRGCHCRRIGGPAPPVVDQGMPLGDSAQIRSYWSRLRLVGRHHEANFTLPWPLVALGRRGFLQPFVAAGGKPLACSTKSARGRFLGRGARQPVGQADWSLLGARAAQEPSRLCWGKPSGRLDYAALTVSTSPESVAANRQQRLLPGATANQGPGAARYRLRSGQVARRLQACRR